MKYMGILLLMMILAGCKSAPKTCTVPPNTRVEEMSIKIANGEEWKGQERITVTLYHSQSVKEKKVPGADGKKVQFSITVEPGIWAKIKRGDTVIGYSSESECLIDGEMVNVSGMPGDNFTVKVEALAIDKYRVMGIFLNCRHTEHGEMGKTISFDFVSDLGDETTVYRKKVVYDPEERLNEEGLLRDKS